MVVRFKGTQYEHHEPPYTEEEEFELYRAANAPPVAMTSVTRPSNATPVSKTGDAPPRPAKPRT